ncbi:Tyrosine recombinase XerD [subsurface metagenome]
MSKTPTILTTEETERILNAIRFPKGPRTQTMQSYRNYLCCLFMLDAGLRVSEVIQLKRFMLWKDGQVVSSLSVPAEIAKLHRSRIIPMSEALRDEIIFMHDNVWINLPEASLGYVFHSGGYQKHITARRIQQVISQAGLATIGRRVWPHVFRHSFANRLMRVTNIRVVQELLGHKNLTSTQIYTHPNSQDLLKAITAIKET